MELTVGQLRAGTARTIVTPPLGTYLIGYADRSSGCKSVHDELTATALALDDGARQLLLIALDMLVLNELIVARVREGILARWGIPAGQVIICCSHTHSGPVAYADLWSKPKHRRFIKDLVVRLVSVAGEALAARTPATFAWGQGEGRISTNRRELLPDGRVIIGVNPGGPVDRSLQVLQICRQNDGLPLATLVNHACHATTLGPASYAVSADWPGAMRRAVEGTVGGHCMFIQGATGDLNPAHDWGDDDLDVMEELGRQVGAQVLEVVDALAPLESSPLAARTEPVRLPLVPQKAPGRHRPLTYRQVLGREAGVPRFLVDPILRARYPWKTRLEQRDGQWYVVMEIQVFRLGDCALVAHAAETFNEIGVAIKSESPAAMTLFAGYSNGCVGYLPTEAAHALGGYEVDLAPYFYRMPGLLDPGCETLVTGKSLGLLRHLWPEAAPAGGEGQ
jgi:hypothetical protein